MGKCCQWMLCQKVNFVYSSTVLGTWYLVLGSCSSKILLKGVYTGGVLSRLVANFCFSLRLLFAVMFWIHSRLFRLLRILVGCSSLWSFLERMSICMYICPDPVYFELLTMYTSGSVWFGRCIEFVVDINLAMHHLIKTGNSSSASLLLEWDPAMQQLLEGCDTKSCVFSIGRLWWIWLQHFGFSLVNLCFWWCGDPKQQWHSLD